MQKVELCELIKLNKSYDEYYLDKTMEENGHAIVRLPPYHPELNPVKLVWVKIKNKMAGKSVTNNLVEKNGTSKMV